MNRDGANKSLWQNAELSAQNRQSEYKSYDAIIAGAGITGITTALNLQQAGKKCLIIEAANPGFGTTGGTTSHINNFYDAQYDVVQSKFGEGEAKLLAETGPEILDFIKKNIADYHIDCEYSDRSSFVFSVDDKQDSQLKDFYKATKEVGILIEKVEENPFPIPFKTIVKIDGQGQFHPLKYIAALLEEYKKLGGDILCNTRVTEVTESGDAVAVVCEGPKFSTKDFVWATHVPPGINRMNMFTAPYRSYVLAFTLKSGHYPEAQAADFGDPYHYYRTQQTNGKTYIIAGGEDHKTGTEDDTEACFQNLETYVRRYFDIDKVENRWSSQYYTPNDSLPFIGLAPGEKHIYWATGYDGNGISFGTLAGMMIPDLILGKGSKYETLFSPARINVAGGIKENISEAASAAYEFIKGKLSSEKLDSLQDLKNNEGKVVTIEGEKLAVYRDNSGKIHALSSVCSHMGCTVAFNNTEKTWDCPCHGARYSVDGEVLNGPAIKPLEKLDV